MGELRDIAISWKQAEKTIKELNCTSDDAETHSDAALKDAKVAVKKVYERNGIITSSTWAQSSSLNPVNPPIPEASDSESSYVVDAMNPPTHTWRRRRRLTNQRLIDRFIRESE